ncbi:MAG: glycosyltransferase family 2 protein [Paraprevotella sp.]|nr:glycosyltransferase family 2 protein [Paraprevotella sp.]
MEKPQISILVPIFKVEAYLPRCIDSVLSQDYKDYELILVDDGSPDSCPKICDDYASKYDCIHVVHKVNGGLISARRAGVLASKGRYIMFLDSDDWLQPNALSTLYRYICKGYDMVKGGAQRVTSDGRVCPLERYAFSEGVINGTAIFLEKMYTGEVAPYLWGALYKASLFDEDIFNDSIKKNISLGEDLVTNLIVGMRMEKVLYITDIVYNYFFNPASIMSTKLVSSDYGKRLEYFLYERVFTHYPVLKEWQQAKFACYCFRNCFIPEVGFSDEYDKYVQYLKEPCYREKIHACIQKKYLLFVTCKPAYQIYSAIYRLAYKYIKQKGKQKTRLK